MYSTDTFPFRSTKAIPTQSASFKKQAALKLGEETETQRRADMLGRPLGPPIYQDEEIMPILTPSMAAENPAAGQCGTRLLERAG